MEFSLTRPLRSTGRSPRGLDRRVGLLQVLQPERDDRRAVDAGFHRPLAQVALHRLGERRAPARRAARRRGARHVGAARVEMEVQRAPLVLAQRLLVELAHDVARHVAHDRAARSCRRSSPGSASTRSLIAASSSAADIPSPRPAADSRAAASVRAAGSAARRASRSNSMNPLPDSPASRSSTSSPHGFALVYSREPRVPGVRRDLALHVVVPERHVAPLRRAQRGHRDLHHGAVHARHVLGEHPLHLAVQHEHVVA